MAGTIIKYKDEYTNINEIEKKIQSLFAIHDICFTK